MIYLVHFTQLIQDNTSELRVKTYRLTWKYNVSFLNRINSRTFPNIQCIPGQTYNILFHNTCMLYLGCMPCY